MTVNINDKVQAQLTSPSGRKISPAFLGTIISINGSKCMIKWENNLIAAQALSAFQGNAVDIKYLTLV